VKNQWNISY